MRHSLTAALVVLLLLGGGVGYAQQPAPPILNQSLLQQQYDILAAPLTAETDVTVGTTATRVLNNDPARVDTVIANTGTTNCAIATSPQVTITTGIVLAAGGGTLSEGFRDDFTIPTYQHWAVCAAAGGTLHILTVDLQ